MFYVRIIIIYLNSDERRPALRRQAGVTQEQLANETGLTVESISNMERGIFGPKFDNLEKIAQTLDVPVKALFEFEIN